MRSLRLGASNLKNFVTFVLFVVIDFLTTKDTKHTKEEDQGIVQASSFLLQRVRLALSL